MKIHDSLCKLSYVQHRRVRWLPVLLINSCRWSRNVHSRCWSWDTVRWLDILNRGNCLTYQFKSIRWLRLDHSMMQDKLGIWVIFIIRLVMSLGDGCVLVCCEIILVGREKLSTLLS